ncbi:MAG: hypothetical protein ACTSXZ_10205 [Alphaproteobacteria bacterium]
MTKKKPARPLADPGTPETRRKVRPDTVTRLVTTGRLQPVHITAAADIIEAFETLTKGLGWAQWDYARIPTARSAPKGGWPHRLDKIIERYTRWTQAMQTELVPLSLVIDAVVHGATCRALDRANHRRDGWAAEILLVGLDLYCGEAGWVNGPARRCLPRLGAIG